MIAALQFISLNTDVLRKALVSDNLAQRYT
jgi:hypothetical protein